MRLVRRFVPLALAWALVPVSAEAREPARPAPAPQPRVDVRQLGPQVGDTVPAFRLVDQHGTPRTLASVLGPSGGLLVLFRSADW